MLLRNWLTGLACLVWKCSHLRTQFVDILQLALTGVVCKIKIKNQGRMNNHLKKEIVTEKNYEEKRKRKPRRNTKREMQRE